MTVTPILSKTCTKCGEEKSAGDFCKRTASNDGLSPKCRACQAAYAIAYSAAHKEEIKSTKALYFANNRERHNAACAEWARKNPEKKRMALAANRAKNKEQCKATRVKWIAANIDRVKANIAAWHNKNPDVRRIRSHNYRDKKRENGGILTKGLADKLFKLQRGLCPCCKEPLGKDFHLDHKMPIARGGSNTDDNMQLLRKTCNLQKNAKHPIEFMQERGFLL